MNDLFFRLVAQMRRIGRYFHLWYGIARVDDQRLISGIIFVIKNGLRRRGAIRLRPHKTTDSRIVRWSRLAVFNKISSELPRKSGKSFRLMVDATYL